MLSLKYDISEIPIELPYRKQGNSKNGNKTYVYFFY